MFWSLCCFCVGKHWRNTPWRLTHYISCSTVIHELTFCIKPADSAISCLNKSFNGVFGSMRLNIEKNSSRTLSANVSEIIKSFRLESSNGDYHRLNSKEGAGGWWMSRLVARRRDSTRSGNSQFLCIPIGMYSHSRYCLYGGFNPVCCFLSLSNDVYFPYFHFPSLILLIMGMCARLTIATWCLTSGSFYCFPMLFYILICPTFQ